MSKLVVNALPLFIIKISKKNKEIKFYQEKKIVHRISHVSKLSFFPSFPKGTLKKTLTSYRRHYNKKLLEEKIP